MADPHEPRSFAQFIATVEDGTFQADATAAVAEIVETLRDHAAEFGGKPAATLSLKLTFKLDGGLMEVTPALTKTLPTPPRRKSVYWPTEQGGLTRNNPHQRELPVFDVTPAGAIREV